MATRGCFCIVYKGICYGFYNHWDSYLSGMGMFVLLWVLKHWRKDRFSEVKTKVSKMRPCEWIVDERPDYTELDEFVENGFFESPICDDNAFRYFVDLDNSVLVINEVYKPFSELTEDVFGYEEDETELEGWRRLPEPDFEWSVESIARENRDQIRIRQEIEQNERERTLGFSLSSV